MLKLTLPAIICASALAFGLAAPVNAQVTGITDTGTPVTVPNVVVSVEGCGIPSGTCLSVPNGTGPSGSYGDNQAGPLTLFYFTPASTFSGQNVPSAALSSVLVLPQTGSVANLAVSGEYGSSSEGTLQLSTGGQYLTIVGYGVNANAFNTNSNAYSASPNTALAQSGSLTGQSYTPIPRVVTFIDANGNINSSTALYNIFDNNNPRSTYTLDGVNFYVSGQGNDDATGGVFYTPSGSVNLAPTSITGLDGGSGESQDTRDVQIANNTLYVSMDSKDGSYNRSYIGTLGTPPYTTTYSCATAAGGVCPTSVPNGPSLLNGLGNAGGTGREKLSAAQTNGLVPSNTYINLSPENYFFASPTVLYIADSGSPKNTSADNETTYSLCGAGGLQKWVNVSGTWTWEYTMSAGLNLVKNANSKSGDTTCSTNTDGTTGLTGLTGYVSGGIAYLFATNYTIADLDPTFLYTITDTLTASSNSSSFTKLATAPAGSNFKGVSLAPTLPSGSVEVLTSPSGLAFSASGTDCAPGSYTAPVTLNWTGAPSCTLSVVSPQADPTLTGTQYSFSQWQDGTTTTTDTVPAPASPAVYTATFNTQYLLTTSAGTGGTVSAGGYFNSGTNPTITATPSSGYYFVSFTSGENTYTSNPLTTLTMTGPMTVTANFALQVTPTITWSTPAAISYGTALSTTQLDASSGGVAGTFVYNPASGAVLPPGNNQSLSVTFTPTNTAEYTTATGSTTITVNTTATDVSSQVKVTTTGFVYSRATGAYTGTVTILNTGSTSIATPIQSVFTSLISGATLANATGTVPNGSYAGAPYITLSGSSPLAPGASVSFPVKFTYTGTAPISFVSKTLSGVL